MILTVISIIKSLTTYSILEEEIENELCKNEVKCLNL